MTTLQNKPAKGRTVAYWIITSLLVLGMLSGAVSQLLRLKANTDGIIHLGYPFQNPAFLTISMTIVKSIDH